MTYPDDYINKILHGDCLELMKQIPDGSVDLVLTDPPYGVKRDKGFDGSRSFGGSGKPIACKRYETDNWDSERPDRIYFENILRISKLAIIFGGNFFADFLPQGTHWIVWDKLNTMPSFGDCELLWTNSTRKSVKKITRAYNGLIGKEGTRYHPTQKPVNLLFKIIKEYSGKDDLILDPFCGSGTTCVAAKALGRRFIGIEKEQKYVDIANRRLHNTIIELFY